MWLGVLLPLAWIWAGGPAFCQSEPPIVHVYYFDAPGCTKCLQAKALIRRLARTDPQISVRSIPVLTAGGYELADALLTIGGVDKSLPAEGPSLLVGTTFVRRMFFEESTVRAAIDRYRATGAPDLYPRAVNILGHAHDVLPQQMRRWGLAPVIVAGLLDGINPCAFATLIFFLAYLGLTAGQSRKALAVGLLFVAGVFGAYFAFGFGIVQAILALEVFPQVRTGLHALIAVGCLVLAWLSARDYRQLKAGNTAGVSLQLPRALKQQTHHAIRHGLRSSWLYPASFVAGAAVSMLELACTGQVYVPAIIYLLSLSDTRTAALGRWRQRNGTARRGCPVPISRREFL